MSLPPVITPLGAMRFNSDSHKLEYWNGEAWFQIHTDVSAPIAGRGIILGSGSNPRDEIQYFNLTTRGDALDFGNLATAAFSTSAASSSTRGMFAGGGINSSPNQFANNIIQYITIASTGNASGLSNSTTAVFAGGCTDNGGSTATNIIDYVTISSLGNAVKFGETTATCLRTQGSSDSHGGIS